MKLNTDIKPTYSCSFDLRRRSGKNASLTKGNQMISSNDNLHYRVKTDLVRYLRYHSFDQEKHNLTPDYPLFSPKRPCGVVITICPPTKRRVDPPNFYPTVKPLIDGLTDAGLWSDDNGKVIQSMTFLLGPQTKNKLYRLDIDVYEIKAGDDHD